MGPHCLRVPMRMFALNRQRLCHRLKECKDVPSGAIVLLQGGEQEQRYCTDTDIVFRQVSATDSLPRLITFICVTLSLKLVSRGSHTSFFHPPE